MVGEKMGYEIEGRYAAEEEKERKIKTPEKAERVTINQNNVETLLNQIDSKLDLILAKQEGE